MILSSVLSAFVLFGCSFISDRYFPTASEPSTRIVEGKQVPIPQPDEDPTADAPVAVRDRQAVLAETPRVAIETPRLEVSINLRGARLDDLVLTDYRQSLAEAYPLHTLLSPFGS